MQTTFRDTKGFTLIEAIVAIAIFTVGIMGVGTMLQVSMHYDTASISVRSADAVAKEIIEELKGDIASTPIQKSVSNLANLRLTDPNFTYAATNYPAPGCPAGVNCLQQLGYYGAIMYKWRVDDGPDPASNPTNQTWANTWRLQVVVGWDNCSNPPGSCTDMGGGRWSYRSTQITTFLVPLPLNANP